MEEFQNVPTYTFAATWTIATVLSTLVTFRDRQCVQSRADIFAIGAISGFIAVAVLQLAIWGTNKPELANDLFWVVASLVGSMGKKSLYLSQKLVEPILKKLGIHEYGRRITTDDDTDSGDHRDDRDGDSRDVLPK